MCMVKVVDEKEIKTKIYGEMKSNDRRWKHVKCMNVLESSRGWEGKGREEKRVKESSRKVV